MSSKGEQSRPSPRVRTREADKLFYCPNRATSPVELFPSDLKCLEPSTFLNDAVIQFYITYLMAECCPEPQRIHVFDNYFHNNLRDMFEDHTKTPNVAKWRQLYKWYNKQDIFEKDFLVFPVCRDAHWFTIIVCHPKEVLGLDASGLQLTSSSRVERQPAVLLLDSVGLTDQLLTKEVRYFLDFEWRASRNSVKDFFYHNLVQYHPKLPRQTNAYDCGLFMLAYLKAFIEQPEKFYQAVLGAQRNDKKSDLDDMINGSLSHCGRNAIKNLVRRLCRSTKVPR